MRVRKYIVIDLSGKEVMRFASANSARKHADQLNFDAKKELYTVRQFFYESNS